MILIKEYDNYFHIRLTLDHYVSLIIYLSIWGANNVLHAHMEKWHV